MNDKARKLVNEMIETFIPESLIVPFGLFSIKVSKKEVKKYIFNAMDEHPDIEDKLKKVLKQLQEYFKDET